MICQEPRMVFGSQDLSTWLWKAWQSTQEPPFYPFARIVNTNIHGGQSWVTWGKNSHWGVGSSDLARISILRVKRLASWQSSPAMRRNGDVELHHSCHSASNRSAHDSISGNAKENMLEPRWAWKNKIGQQLNLRDPTTTLFISRDTCSHRHAKLFPACLKIASRRYRLIRCRMGYRTNMSV